MQIRAFLPAGGILQCDHVAVEGKQVVAEVSSCASAVACPLGHQLSDRTHSHYVRSLADLPWQGQMVTLHCQIRRFRCHNPACTRQIFAERVPEVASPHARKTNRLTAILGAIALACGGEEGARLADRLGVNVSADMLLGKIRRPPLPPCTTVRALGVDDWATRRGQRYGTILIDLESHCVVDLLPDRSSKSFAAWLVAHPEIEILSRDRDDCYIKGASSGAPQATQVADRWHMIHNLQEALVRFVERFRHELKQADQQVQRTSKILATVAEPQLLPERERTLTQTAQQQ